MKNIEKVIKFAYENPETRKKLLPHIKKQLDLSGYDSSEKIQKAAKTVLGALSMFKVGTLMFKELINKSPLFRSIVEDNVVSQMTKIDVPSNSATNMIYDKDMLKINPSEGDLILLSLASGFMAASAWVALITSLEVFKNRKRILGIIKNLNKVDNAVYQSKENPDLIKEIVKKSMDKNKINHHKMLRAMVDVADRKLNKKRD